MTRRGAAFLLGLAAFMIIEWINLGFNLQDGHETSFYVIHGILIVVNVILGAILGVIGLRAWRATGDDARRTGTGERTPSGSTRA
ncbi:hypothetical protein GCM10010106_39060 [Thermopolyspora flexuosa]|jgi:hypothetical protein|uniref:Uncharacterized protein n=1 Tax=Thermopolyspora flexuosa TaxID=103836 RepID=A0A543J2B8_9ACTN|nr:hypothetical protein [Thermopolyspora flexuosa]TQM76942.1 hypothetical protein FHX40_3694 [Thermopolyspora flexuosa]GGM88016.1 hypothetical protein GCM10010106_39060 [Thermopolyspora flexuosa]